jgi:hypothetical protein
MLSMYKWHQVMVMGMYPWETPIVPSRRACRLIHLNRRPKHEV